MYKKVGLKTLPPVKYGEKTLIGGVRKVVGLWQNHVLYGSTSCCISHGPCQWERAIFDPPQLRDPWTDFHET